MVRISLGVLLAVVVIGSLRVQYNYTNGYTRTDGTYVHGYWHNVSDGVKWNNLSNWGVSIRGK